MSRQKEGSEPRLWTPVLAVDDAPANLLALSALFEPQGIELATAASGADALALLHGGEFALVLLDVQMPRMDGFEVLAAMRARGHEKTPVIFLTAFEATPAMKKRAYELGAFDFLTKPVDVDALRGKAAAFVALYEHGRALKRQAEALQAKDRFIGVLAHDLRTPISIVTYSARLLEIENSDSARQIAARMKRAATRMEQLTRDLLDYARAAAERMPIRRSEVDLSALCRELLEDFPAGSAALFTFSAPDTMLGSWDSDRLQQALSNLIANAVKYGDGRVRIDLSAGDERALLSISNGGRPIGADRLERIFEPFEQGDVSNPGVGLGLYIVREIVRAHGGDVSVSSSEEGTTFRLALPLRREG